MLFLVPYQGPIPAKSHSKAPFQITSRGQQPIINPCKYQGQIFGTSDVAYTRVPEAPRLPNAHRKSSEFPHSRSWMASLYAEGHNGVDDVVVILLERLDSLLPRDARLLHDQFDVLRLKSRVVDLLAVVLLLFLLLFDSLALAVVVVVVVSGVVVSTGLGGGKLLGCRSLGLRVQVLDLGLAEDAMLTSESVRHNRLNELTSTCCLMVTCKHQAG